MADRAFTTLISKVSPSVPGCPQPLIIEYIRDAAIKLCERTLMWRYVQPTFTLEPGVFEYAYNKPLNADVHVLFDAMMNDMPLEKLTLEQALMNYPQWADIYSGQPSSTVWSLTPSTSFNNAEFNSEQFNQQPTVTVPESIVADGTEPRSICQITPDKYVVLPLPDNDKTYTVRMFYALKPKRDASGMDSVVLDELESAVVHRALQELLVLPNVAWADRELATYHARQCLFETTERRARANLANMRGMMAVQFPRFA
jgi:hypothetical protein